MAAHIIAKALAVATSKEGFLPPAIAAKVPRTNALLDQLNQRLEAVTKATPKDEVLNVVQQHMSEVAAHAIALELELRALQSKARNVLAAWKASKAGIDIAAVGGAMDRLEDVLAKPQTR
jgi:hypothetical protein